MKWVLCVQSAIAISSDSSDESVGSLPSRVILFGDIPIVIPSTFVDSLEYITPLPATLPFLYTDSSKAFDSSDGPPSQDPYVATVVHWRTMVTARSPSPSDFPIAPVTALPGTRRRAAILI
ncbi:hypothetical protein Tco_0096878 [Tanacetum coccineum]